MSKKILIIAGEASGDLYGAHLVLALKKRHPEAKFSGVGGAEMTKAGVEIVYPIHEIAIMGVSEIFSKLGNIKELYSILCKKLDEERFDLGILVNYPGFNLRFAKVLKKRGIPVIFYSSPQVWAWGGWRVNGIKKFVDKMIVFLKFEEDFYKKHGVEAEFVGHPLIDIVKPSKDDLGIRKEKDRKIISLVPGSRMNEIKSLYSQMLEAAKIIHSRYKNVQFLITKHPELPYQTYQVPLQKYNIPAKIIDGKIYECLNISDIAIIVSGSATLEATILRTPMVIIYKVSFVTGLLFLLFVRIVGLGLVNIIAGRRIMPELLQYRATGRNIAREIINILSNNERYKKMKEDLERVNSLLGLSGASERAAEIISKI